MKVGLFFGSFNPVHVGHMIVANYMVEYSDIERLWMVLSPQNPFKAKEDLANNYDRLHLLDLAIGDNKKIKWSQVEFSMPIPSYTIDTLTHLRKEYPKNEFVVVMGGDNINGFHKWKKYQEILEHHQVYVYRREQNAEAALIDHPKVEYFEAPLIEVSGSAIRKAIKNRKSVQYLVPDAVFEFLSSSQLYR